MCHHKLVCTFLPRISARKTQWLAPIGSDMLQCRIRKNGCLLAGDMEMELTPAGCIRQRRGWRWSQLSLVAGRMNIQERKGIWCWVTKWCQGKEEKEVNMMLRSVGGFALFSALQRKKGIIWKCFLENYFYNLFLIIFMMFSVFFIK